MKQQDESSDRFGGLHQMQPQTGGQGGGEGAVCRLGEVMATEAKSKAKTSRQQQAGSSKQWCTRECMRLDKILTGQLLLQLHQLCEALFAFVNLQSQVSIRANQKQGEPRVFTHTHTHSHTHTLTHTHTHTLSLCLPVLHCCLEGCCRRTRLTSSCCCICFMRATRSSRSCSCLASSSSVGTCCSVAHSTWGCGEQLKPKHRT